MTTITKPREDRKGRPISTLTRDERQTLLEQLLGIWHQHPRWGLGQLVHKAACIESGTRVSVEKASDATIIHGLVALTPERWEVEDHGESPAFPHPIRSV